MHIADNLLSIRRHTSSSYLTHQRNSTLLDSSKFFKFDCDLQLVWKTAYIEAIILWCHFCVWQNFFKFNMFFFIDKHEVNFPISLILVNSSGSCRNWMSESGTSRLRSISGYGLLKYILCMYYSEVGSYPSYCLYSDKLFNFLVLLHLRK